MAITYEVDLKDIEKFPKSNNEIILKDFQLSCNDGKILLIPINNIDTFIDKSNIKLLTYILNSLCTRELSNEGRHFLQNEIKKRGGNYKG